VVAEMGPGDMVLLGKAVEDAFGADERLFPVLRSIREWRTQKDVQDRMEIGGGRVERLRAEANAIRDWVEWGRDWDPSRLRYFEETFRPPPDQMAVFYQRLRAGLDRLERHLPPTAGEVEEMFTRINSLCEASHATDNPVEFIY
jgi:hypothetical protein